MNAAMVTVELYEDDLDDTWTTWGNWAEGGTGVKQVPDRREGGFG